MFGTYCADITIFWKFDSQIIIDLGSQFWIKYDFFQYPLWMWEKNPWWKNLKISNFNEITIFRCVYKIKYLYEILETSDSNISSAVISRTKVIVINHHLLDIMYFMEMLHSLITLDYTYLLSCRCIHRTVDVWPYNVCIHWPLSAFHTFRVRSVLPLIIVLPDICEDHTPPVCPTKVRRHCKT